MEIGTGADLYAWQPISPGDELTIHAGLQGGYHIWGGFRGDGFDPKEILFTFALFDGAREVGGATFLDEARRGASGNYEVSGITVFIADDVSPPTLDGHALRMTVEVRSQDGRCLSDEATFVARCCAELP